MQTQQMQQPYELKQQLRKLKGYLHKALGRLLKGFTQKQRIRATVIVAIIATIVIIIVQVLSILSIIPTIWSTILTTVVATLGVLFAFLALLPIQSSSIVKYTYRGILGLPSLTDARTIQQREETVKNIYAKLIQLDITALVLTGIGGAGKSTLAALVYQYIENQRHVGKCPFNAEPIWLRIDQDVTMADLVGTLCEALNKPMPDLSSLSPQNQAKALFNILSQEGKARLVILDQFENLLDWQTGKVLSNHPGIGEWIDILNSNNCRCRVLLTSRTQPQGILPAPMTYLQEYPIRGMSGAEGVDLLRKQGVTVAQGTDAVLQVAVERCSGHALSLTMLATILRDNNLSLAFFFHDPTFAQFWTGDIASNLLDYIYKQQFNEAQRKLLLAFSIYREAVPLSAAESLIDFNEVPKSQMLPAIKTLLAQHLLQASGKGRYQLHAIVADYAYSHFDEDNDQANQQALRKAHARAAEYYRQQTINSRSPHEQRRQINDIHDLIEAIWQYRLGEKWKDVYDLMEREDIFTYLKRWGNYAMLLDLYQFLLPSDKWHPEPLQEARIYNNLGEVYNALDQKETARNWYEKALSIRQDNGDRKGEGETLNNLGEVYRARGAEDKALKYYQDSLSIRREISDREGEGETLNNLGFFYRNSPKYQNYEEALKYYQDSLRVRREISDREGEATTLHNMGVVFYKQGKKDEARKHYKEALSIDKETGNRKGEGLTLWDIGNFYLNEHKYDIALASYLLARDVFGELQIPKRVAVMQGRMERILRLRNVDENQFAGSLAQVKPRAYQIVEQALSEGME